jgi:hypothetical protein
MSGTLLVGAIVGLLLIAGGVLALGVRAVAALTAIALICTWWSVTRLIVALVASRRE